MLDVFSTRPSRESYGQRTSLTWVGVDGQLRALRPSFQCEPRAPLPSTPTQQQVLFKKLAQSLTAIDIYEREIKGLKSVRVSNLDVLQSADWYETKTSLCRTEALGGRWSQCEDCDELAKRHNSCGDLTESICNYELVSF